MKIKYPPNPYSEGAIKAAFRRIDWQEINEQIKRDEEREREKEKDKNKKVIADKAYSISEHRWKKFNKHRGNNISGYENELEFNSFLQGLRDKKKILDFDWLSIERKSTFDFVVWTGNEDNCNKIAVDVVGTTNLRGNKISLNTSHKNFYDQIEELEENNFDRGYLTFLHTFQVSDTYKEEWRMLLIKEEFRNNIFISAKKIHSLRTWRTTLNFQKR